MQTKQKFSTFFSSLKDKASSLRTNQTFLICMLLSVIYLISGYCKWIEILVSVTALIFMAILPLQSAFCIFMFLHSFTLSNIGYDSCFMVTLIGFCIILLVKYILGVKKGKYTFNKKLVLSLSWFLAISMTISLLHDLYRGAFLYLLYIPFIYFIFTMRNEFDINQGMSYMLGGLLTSSALAIISLCFPKFQYNTFAGGRFSAFINNTNYLYMRALFVLSYYMYRYLNNSLSHAKFLSIFILSAILTLATLSKTGFGLLIALIILFLIIYLKQDFKKRIKIIGIAFLLLCVISLIGFKFIMALFDRFAQSFKSNNFLNSLLTGRDDIWKDYLTACFESPWKFLFGHGILAEEVFITAQQTTRASHNLYIFMLYRFGAVGCFFVGYVIYKTIKSISFDKPKFITYLPLIYILVLSLFDNTFKCYHFTYFVFAIMILFMTKNEIISIDNNTDSQKKKEINKT